MRWSNTGSPFQVTTIRLIWFIIAPNLKETKKSLSAVSKDALRIPHSFFQKHTQLGTKWKADLQEDTLNPQSA